TSSTGRTGLGVSEDGKRVIMVVAEYRTSGVPPPTGVSTPQLAKILQALGAFNAMNFDGGGSSSMFVKGLGTNGRVSVNGSSERAVKSVIYVK
ncbi:MAG TPA: phosphodiester glycosidase family protein, partial [Niabella sp.]|nr:phosphodiester glycosidase family protein [Niabella sp.]